MSNKTRQLWIGSVPVGGGAAVSVQSMTNTRTTDVSGTVQQIRRLAAAGCEIVRVAVPDQQAADCLQRIKADSPIPVIADIHFDYRLALTALDQGIDGLRINPGNIGGADSVAKVVEKAKQRHVPIRIGVNAGSLEKHLLARYGSPCPEAMVESALGHIAILERLDFHDIKISLKAHDVLTTVAAYQLMSEKVDYPLHIGITEAGTVRSGVVKSSVGLGILLYQGIGDTMRVSLTGDPVQEVHVAYQILRSLGIRKRGPELISCPTCGRTQIDLAAIAEQVEQRLQNVDKPITVAVMGCVVNGPGEARDADVGIAGGIGEGLLFRKGEIIRKVPENELVDALWQEIQLLIGEETV